MIILTEFGQVEHQIEQLHMLFILCCIVGSVCLLLAFIFFFAFHIPKIVGELSGETARRKIRELEQSNESSYLQKRKKLFDTGKGISWDMKNQTVNASYEEMEEDQETQILDPENKTTVLTENQTQALETPEL